MGGFIRAGISPHIIISAVREWLEEGENSGVLQRVVINIPFSTALLNLMARYFPLIPLVDVHPATPGTKTGAMLVTDDINLDSVSSFGGSEHGEELEEEASIEFTANKQNSSNHVTTEPIAIAMAEAQAANEALEYAKSLLSNRVESILEEGLPPIPTSPQLDTQATPSNYDLELDKLDSILAELDEQVTSLTLDEEEND